MKFNNLTDDDIEYIKDNVDNIDHLITFIDTLLDHAFDEGFSAGEFSGWNDCYETYYEDDFDL